MRYGDSYGCEYGGGSCNVVLATQHGLLSIGRTIGTVLVAAIHSVAEVARRWSLTD